MKRHKVCFSLRDNLRHFTTLYDTLRHSATLSDALRRFCSECHKVITKLEKVFSCVRHCRAQLVTRNALQQKNLGNKKTFGPNIPFASGKWKELTNSLGMRWFRPSIILVDFGRKGAVVRKRRLLVKAYGPEIRTELC